MFTRLNNMLKASPMGSLYGPRCRSRMLVIDFTSFAVSGASIERSRQNASLLASIRQALHCYLSEVDCSAYSSSSNSCYFTLPLRVALLGLIRSQQRLGFRSIHSDLGAAFGVYCDLVTRLGFPLVSVGSELISVAGLAWLLSWPV